VSQTRYSTDEELAAAVEKIVTAVHENLPKLKIAVPDLVRVLTDAEWSKVRDDEDRRRAPASAAMADVDAATVDLHDVVARLPALERIRRDLDYRLPGSGRPLANIALTREQAAEVLALCRNEHSTGGQL
jgi:hypothetical protein